MPRVWGDVTTLYNIPDDGREKLEREEDENDDEGQEGNRLICTDHNIYSTFIFTFLVALDILELRSPSDITRVFFEQMREKESQTSTSQKPCKTILKS